MPKKQSRRGDPGEWVTPEGFTYLLWVPGGAYYDPELPAKFEEFSFRYLQWLAGPKAGEPVVWSDWQLDQIIRPTLGLHWRGTGLRVIRKVFFLAARGNAKTSLGAAFGLFFLSAVGEPNPTVDLFSVSRMTAERLWWWSDRWVRQSDVLSSEMTVHDSRKRIVFDGNGGEMVVRSGDADAEQGLNSSLAIIDEVLALKNRDLYEAAAMAGAGKRTQPLLMMLTTPSKRTESFARDEYRVAKRIKADRDLDPSYLPVIYEAETEDDIFDEKTWHKACPALRAGFMDIEVYRSEAAAARLDPVAEHGFRTFRLCMWTNSVSDFVTMPSWDACAAPQLPADLLKHLPAYMGIDTSAARDFSSLCLLWWLDEHAVAYTQWRHWASRAIFDQLVSFTEGHFMTWIKSEAINLTVSEGKIIDLDEVVAAAIDDFAEFGVRGEIGIDAYRSHEMTNKLEMVGLPVQQLSPTGKSMQASLERVGEMIRSGRLRHNGDPVARWMADNSEVRYDSQGFPKLVKPLINANSARIDDMSALMMAMDRRLAEERDSPPEKPKKSRAFVV